MLLTIAFNDSENVIPINVPDDMLVSDLCNYAAQEGKREITADIQLLHNGVALNKNVPISSTGVKDESILVFVYNPNLNVTTPAPLASSNNGSSVSLNSSTSNSEISPQLEAIRTQILYEPTMFAQLSQRFPSLADSLHNPAEFQREYLKHFAKNKDPNAPETRDIEENFFLAMQEMPEAFTTVTMLYVPVEINGVKVKGFVDSGAQATIMSANCASACNLGHLIDKRYKGTAVGVGQAEIWGRIHIVPIKIGESFFPCSLTVLNDNKLDLLIGLDTLRHHQAQIDLKNNCLRMGDQSLPFLGESEIPKNFMNQSNPPPTNDTNQKNNTANSTPGTSTVTKPPNTTFNTPGQVLGSQPYQRPLTQQRPPSSQPNAIPSLSSGPPPGPPPTSTQALQMPQAPPPLTQSHSAPAVDPKVKQLTELGFTEAASRKALMDSGGNTEVAAALLFERDYPDA